MKQKISPELPPELVKAVNAQGLQYVAAPWASTPNTWVVCELIFPEVFPPFGMPVGVAIAKRRDGVWIVEALVTGTLSKKQTDLTRRLQHALNSP